ncbi:MAG: tetratricopeptide repeat protein [Ignavibacteriaceae bacterium]
MEEKDKYTLAIDDFNLAYKYHLDGRIEEAIEYYKKSIELFPTAKAHTFLGWAYSLQGNFEDAIGECKIAVDLNPDYGNPYNDIGSYLISLKQYDEAIYWLEQSLEVPDYELRHYPLYNLGFICEKKGEWFTALTYYKDALELSPDYARAKAAVTRITCLLN